MKTYKEFITELNKFEKMVIQKGPKREKGYIYKAFRSFRPNSLLGKYLRKRMNIKSGKPFKESDFKRYGRDTIDLSLLGEGQYYADFSVKNKSN